jgi:phosphonate transport system substrate-binding protein
MKQLWVVLTVVLVVVLTVVLVALVVGLIAWLWQMPPGHESNGRVIAPLAAAADQTPLHIGLVPERDIFQLRKRYLALTGYLSKRLGRPVDVVTVNTYQAVLQDFAEKKIDAAFLGSLVAVLTVDRMGARVLVKPVDEAGVSTYRGVIFVKPDSPIQRIEDLAGRSVAMVKTTYAGELFPLWEMHRTGINHGATPPRKVWVGTHDDVISETLSGRVEAGAVKNLRLEAFEATHPDAKLRRLATSAPVPNDAFVVRADLAETLGAQLKDVMLAMDKDPEGAKALAAFGAVRFVPCSTQEYAPIYDIVEGLGDHWDRLGIEGPPPKRPSFAAGR